MAPPVVESPDATPPAAAPGASPPASGTPEPDSRPPGSSPTPDGSVEPETTAEAEPAPSPPSTPDTAAVVDPASQPDATADSARATDAEPGPIHTLAEANSIEAARAAGWTPVEIAAELDAETVQRFAPQLSSADATDIANMLADPRVQAMFEQMNSSPDPQRPDLDRQLLAQLAAQPDLARIILASPELATALTGRPITLHNVARHPEAVQALQDVLADIEARGPEAVAARGRPPAEATPLTPRQREVSESIVASHDAAHQPHFNPGRQNDPDYQEQYLDALYADWRSRQDELNDLAVRHARPGEDGGGNPKWREDEKDRGRAWQKISEYGGDVSLLTDLVGASIQFETLDDLYSALERINNDPSVTIVSYDDRFQNPEPSGYRDVQLNVRLSDGHVAEFRLHLAALDEVARWEHSLYEVRRDIRALARTEGRPMTQTEEAIYVRILQMQQELFWTALQSAMPEGGDGA
jgi:hypothetical protein